MIAHRFQTESPTWLRSYNLGTTPLAVSPESERVIALSCVHETGGALPQEDIFLINWTGTSPGNDTNGLA